MTDLDGAGPDTVDAVVRGVWKAALLLLLLILAGVIVLLLVVFI